MSQNKLMPPRFLLEKVVGQCEDIAKQTPTESPFTQPFKSFPKTIPDTDQTRLKEKGMAAIRDQVLPAYRALQNMCVKITSAGRTEARAWALPNGEDYYAFRVKESTTTILLQTRFISWDWHK